MSASQRLSKIQEVLLCFVSSASILSLSGWSSLLFVSCSIHFCCLASLIHLHNIAPFFHPYTSSWQNSSQITPRASPNLRFGRLSNKNATRRFAWSSRHVWAWLSSPFSLLLSSLQHPRIHWVYTTEHIWAKTSSLLYGQQTSISDQQSRLSPVGLSFSWSMPSLLHPRKFQQYVVPASDGDDCWPSQIRSKPLLHIVVSFTAPVLCLVAGLIGTSFFYGVNTSNTNFSLHGWSCQWSSVDMDIQPKWNSLCRESKAALYLTVMMIPLQVIVLSMVVVESSLHKKTTRVVEHERKDSPALSWEWVVGWDGLEFGWGGWRWRIPDGTSLHEDGIDTSETRLCAIRFWLMFHDLRNSVLVLKNMVSFMSCSCRASSRRTSAHQVW